MRRPGRGRAEREPAVSNGWVPCTSEQERSYGPFWSGSRFFPSEASKISIRKTLRFAKRLLRIGRSLPFYISNRGALQNLSLRPDGSLPNPLPDGILLFQVQAMAQRRHGGVGFLLQIDHLE